MRTHLSGNESLCVTEQSTPCPRSEGHQWAALVLTPVVTVQGHVCTMLTLFVGVDQCVMECSVHVCKGVV